MTNSIPTLVAIGRINHDMIYIEQKVDEEYRIAESLGGAAAYAGLAAAAQGEKVGLVSFGAKELLSDPMYTALGDNPGVDLSGVKFSYDKMPDLKVWYPNNGRKLTIGMIWDDNPEISRDMIPEQYLKSDAFLFMPLINEIPADVVMELKQQKPSATYMMDIQGNLRFLKPAADCTPDEWEGVPGELVKDWTNRQPSRRVFYDSPVQIDKLLTALDILKVNEGELAVLTGKPVEGEDESLIESVKEAVAVLEEKAEAVDHKSLIIAVTLGKFGCFMSYSKDGQRTREFITAIPPRVDNINPTGAGDTFSVSFLNEYRRSKDVVYSARYATAASSLAVETDGPTICPSREAILNRLSEHYK